MLVEEYVDDFCVGKSAVNAYERTWESFHVRNLGSFVLSRVFWVTEDIQV